MIHHLIRCADEWQACTDPHILLAYLEGKVSDRKLRLFACACVRRYGERLNRQGRQAIETSERFADGLATVAQLAEVREGLPEAEYYPGDFVVPPEPAARATTEEVAREAVRATLQALRRLAWSDGAFEGVPGLDERQAASASADAEARAECVIARHVFGNSFHPVAVDPRWLRWDHGIVAKVARIIYEERRFDQLPILADAVEEAGCMEEAILTHFRQPGDHERGCWALDLLIGRG